MHHLDDNGFFPIALMIGFRSINRPYVLEGIELERFLQELRNVAVNTNRFTEVDDFNYADFKIIFPLNKEQFLDMYEYCQPVPREGGQRYVTKKDLLLFLCKVRQGLPDEFLKVIFQFSTRQAVSLAIATVRQSLMLRFVPQKLGLGCITPEEFIQRHVTPFANELYNPEPEIPKVIVYMDGKYIRIHKCSNFRTLRQSFCLYKGHHLVKPALIVAPNGYILDVHGPYFSDARNNDAAMLLNEFNRDGNYMREWFPEGSIVIVDRGYRDATEFLEHLGIYWKMTPLLHPGQR